MWLIDRYPNTYTEQIIVTSKRDPQIIINNAINVNILMEVEIEIYNKSKERLLNLYKGDERMFRCGW